MTRNGSRALLLLAQSVVFISVFISFKRTNGGLPLFSFADEHFCGFSADETFPVQFEAVDLQLASGPQNGVCCLPSFNVPLSCNSKVPFGDSPVSSATFDELAVSSTLPCDPNTSRKIRKSNLRLHKGHSMVL